LKTDNQYVIFIESPTKVEINLVLSILWCKWTNGEIW